ncbi:hypothetical protein [Actibacterium sp. XHP0104]|uniref:hypothetical protein n=1 Tax=Actibacterium sp. XHP0104 TaxID=2984335 RepID=UPI0021E74F25|nr:hypothetical protein [Actibacterium sp. XHP0104]MCV2880419.1 hypothetical protein [Actibacterium sp. XHP0104]
MTNFTAVSSFSISALTQLLDELVEAQTAAGDVRYKVFKSEDALVDMNDVWTKLGNIQALFPGLRFGHISLTQSGFSDL